MNNLKDASLNDAMGARLLSARWVVTGKLILETAAHFGGKSEGPVDMVVVRDQRSGKPLLPGTTIAGALRNALVERLKGFLFTDNEPEEVSLLFGGSRKSDDGFQSSLIVFDAIGEIPMSKGIEIRDGVAIDPRFGVAEDHKKFDFEILPAGTSFPVRADLLIPAGAEEKKLVESLARALDAFSDAQLGAKRTRGLGQIRVSWAAKRFELNTRTGWTTWLLSDHQQLPRGDDRTPVCTVLEKAFSAVKPLRLENDAREKILIKAHLSISHDVLIRSPNTKPGEADVAHLRSGDKPILSGTSVAGVLRAHALRISKLVREKQKDGPMWVDRLFGPRFEGQRPDKEFRPSASRLRVSESIIESSREQRQIRVAIDRFTQGVVDGALFDEQTEVGGKCTIQLELRKYNVGELGLVLLLLKDLLSGALPIGGSSSVGRGFVTGHADVTWHVEGKTKSAKLKPNTVPEGSAANDIDQAIQEFFEADPILPRVMVGTSV